MMEPMTPSALTPLSGMRVLDVTTSIAGPYCAQILATLGADVIKVERPDTGDDGRAWGPPFWNGEGTMFLSANAGKRSLALSLRDERGREALLRLVDGADVFLQSLRPGLADELGLGPDALRARNPPARLLLGRRLRARRAAQPRAGLRRPDAGGGRPDLDHRRAGPARRARRLVADRPGHGDVGSARRARGAARARLDGRGSGRRRVALRDGARLHRLSPRRVPRGRAPCRTAEGTRFPMVAPYQVFRDARRRADDRRRQRPAVRRDLQRPRATRARRRPPLRARTPIG